MRKSPNIIITGTPGVGKTTHCEVLSQRTGLHHLSINDIVKDRGCHEGWDEEYSSWIVDDDKVRNSSVDEVWAGINFLILKLLDAIEKDVENGGWLIDWHACDLFPRSWIDLVVVLRVESSKLFDRLSARWGRLSTSQDWKDAG
jgi:adenylate kinase